MLHRCCSLKEGISPRGAVVAPAPGGAHRYAELLKDEGVLCKETVEHVLRLAPPLVVEQKDLDLAVEKLRKVLSAVN